MTDSHHSGLPVDRMLTQCRPPSMTTAPCRLEDEIMRAVAVERALAPPRFIEHLPLPFVVLALGSMAAVIVLWLEGYLVSWTALLYGNVVEAMAHPTVTSVSFAASGLLVVSAVLAVLAWGMLSLSGGRSTPSIH